MVFGGAYLPRYQMPIWIQEGPISGVEEKRKSTLCHVYPYKPVHPGLGRAKVAGITMDFYGLFRQRAARSEVQPKI